MNNIVVTNKQNQTINVNNQSNTQGLGLENSHNITVTTLDGTKNYVELENKPLINNIELVGNKTLEELGIQKLGEYASPSDIPTKVSELENDKGYLTQHQDLSNYALKSEIPSVDGLASEEYVQEQIENIDIPEVDLSNYYNKEEIDGMPSNRIMLTDGGPSISIHRSQNISLVDYMKTMTKRGLYSCYVQSGTIDNPPKASSSLRGIFEIYFTKRENGNLIAWIILFDESGQMHTRYVKGTPSEWATNGLPDGTLTKEGISADAKAVGDAIANIELTPGPQGEPGKDGTNGQDGYTPQKGIDYYTEEDKEEMVNLVIEALPSTNEVSY